MLKRKPGFNPPPGPKPPQDQRGAYFHNGAWFDDHDRLIGYARGEDSPITQPGQKVPSKRIAKYNPSWQMNPILAQHTEDAPPIYTGPIIIHDPSSEGGFRRPASSLGGTMASKFNIQRAAARRLSGDKGTPSPPNRPYGEGSQGRGDTHGRHWSGERKMARDNAMSRKWAQYKRSGR